MPLKPFVDKIEDVPEALRGEYVQVQDEKSPINGKFVLSIEKVGGFELAHTEGLMNSLSAARGERDALNEKLKAYGDISPNQAKEGKTALNKLREIGDDPDKKIEAKVNSIKEQLVSAHQNEIQARDTSISKLRQMVEKSAIDAEIEKAVMAEKGDPFLLTPFVRNHVRPKWNDDGSFEVQIVNRDGNPWVKDGSGATASIRDVVASFKTHESLARGFEASGKSGSGSSNVNGGGGHAGLQRSKMDFAAKGEFIDKNGVDAFLALPE